MAEFIEVKPADNPGAEPARTTREAFEAVWEEKGFVEVGSDGDPTPLSDRTVAQLREYAEANDIDLASAKTKPAILAAITAAQEG
jgi:hypothetical protein